MSRSKGSRKPCDVQQARQRLVDAHQFLDAAKLLDAPDVVATCAVHAAIAASGAITCHALGERSNDGNHVSSVDLLRQVDAGLAATLKAGPRSKDPGGLRERRHLRNRRWAMRPLGRATAGGRDESPSRLNSIKITRLQAVLGIARLVVARDRDRPPVAQPLVHTNPCYTLKRNSMTSPSDTS